LVHRKKNQESLDQGMSRWILVAVSLAVLWIFSCSGRPSIATQSENNENTKTVIAIAPSAPPPDSTGGFDGSRAFAHVRHLVELGPRPPGSEAIQRAQSYIVAQLNRYGCHVEQDDFHASTPIGDLPMKNIIAKIPGTGPDILLFATHYDTARLANFVGADDGGSGTGTMLELARVLCARKSKLNVWIAFFDGEEAQGQWTDRASIRWTNANSTFGSRELAARMALSGELPQVKAMILADMIGPSNLRIKRDTNPEPATPGQLESTPWLIDLIWGTAARLGYGNVFINEAYAVGGDDHFSFIRRGVAACDLIDFDVQTSYWHTPQDTLDKVDPRSLAIVGHVLLQTVPALEQKFGG
jgi:glutaminyl-peptide cyclotransferase